MPLGRYLDTRPELAPQRETLLVAAADLERRLEAVEAAGSREASE